MKNKSFDFRKSWYAFLIAFGDLAVIYWLIYATMNPMLRSRYHLVLLIGSSVIISCIIFPFVWKLLNRAAKGAVKFFVLFTILLQCVVLVAGYFILNSYDFNHPLLPQFLPAGFVLPGLFVQFLLLAIVNFRKKGKKNVRLGLV